MHDLEEGDSLPGVADGYRWVRRGEKPGDAALGHVQGGPGHILCVDQRTLEEAVGLGVALVNDEAEM